MFLKWSTLQFIRRTRKDKTFWMTLVMHVTSLIRSLFEKQFYSNSSNDINLPFFGYKCHYVYRHLASILKVGGGGADWSKKSWQAKRPPVATCLVYNFKNYPKNKKYTWYSFEAWHLHVFHYDQSPRWFLKHSLSPQQ